MQGYTNIKYTKQMPVIFTGSYLLSFPVSHCIGATSMKTADLLWNTKINKLKYNHVVEILRQ